ncbi:hypothetical protein RN001_006723 [Aquatica leii]|uniref:Uncharacterized protein n=1 Tax=Aquatica leii TaxID=1421715 RepID=A0AAN7PE10_9COLE|nr:hypothetical protein RN001_006723 [Aquatica leii]
MQHNNSSSCFFRCNILHASWFSSSRAFQKMFLTIQASGGNFSKCASRFDGFAESDVNAFIDSIVVYKDCRQISDVNALKGIPMLLDGFTAPLMTFSHQKPLHKIHRELFLTEHDVSATTDVFVCRARALLSKLPPDLLSEPTQLDMVYGLLHRRIREKVSSDKVVTFSELLKECRLVEESFERGSERNVVRKESREPPRAHRSVYCRKVGHTIDDCRKLAKKLTMVQRLHSKQPLQYLRVH